MPLLHKSDNCGHLLLVLPGATILKLKTSSFIRIRRGEKTHGSVTPQLMK